MATDLAATDRITYRGPHHRLSPGKLIGMLAAITAAATAMAVALTLLAPHWVMALVVAILFVLTLITWHSPRCPNCGQRQYPNFWGVRSGVRHPF